MKHNVILNFMRPNSAISGLSYVGVLLGLLSGCTQSAATLPKMQNENHKKEKKSNGVSKEQDKDKHKHKHYSITVKNERYPDEQAEKKDGVNEEKMGEDEASSLDKPAEDKPQLIDANQDDKYDVSILDTEPPFELKNNTKPSPFFTLSVPPHPEMDLEKSTLQSNKKTGILYVFCGYAPPKGIKGSYVGVSTKKNALSKYCKTEDDGGKLCWYVRYNPEKDTKKEENPRFLLVQKNKNDKVLVKHAFALEIKEAPSSE